MRILHTADWHLGKRLDFFSRHEEQVEVMNEICRIAEEKAVDMVIVAGDLFDAFNPPVGSTELLYKTLKKLTRNATVPVVAIAGNHDSPDRVNVADVLARENGIIFIGKPTDEVPLFETENGFEVVATDTGFIEISLPKYSYPVRLLHTAFANEVRLKEYFGEDKQLSLQESLTQKWESLANKYCDNEGVNLLTSHLFMLKRGGEVPEEPDGEKPINIGTADLIYSDAIPSEVQYVALGHLHRYNDVGTAQPVVYSGSPLSYSFSEASQQKYVAIVDIEPDKEAKIEKVALKSGRKVVRKTFDDIDAAVEWLTENQNSLIELTLVMDEYLKADDRRRIVQANDGIIHIIPKVVNEISSNSSNHAIDLSKDVNSLFVDYFKSKNAGQEPNEELMKLFNEILNN